MTSLPDLDPSRAQTRPLRVAHRLARALAHNGLQVVYQPEVDLLARKLASLEALCRWYDDELGLVAPDEFIAVAEAHGLIRALGEYMLERVLMDMPAVLQRWPQARVAVNVSGIELAQPDFAMRTSAAICRVNPSFAAHLELEVTESVFPHDVSTVRQHLQALREMHLTVAIDDFGTGQSSLSRLHNLPFDKIKLDRGFVSALDNPMVQAIVRALVQLTGSFSRTLVIEGVETPAQLRQLMELGCRMAQGYLLCRPAALKDLPDTITWPLN